MEVSANWRGTRDVLYQERQFRGSFEGSPLGQTVSSRDMEKEQQD